MVSELPVVMEINLAQKTWEEYKHDAEEAKKSSNCSSENDEKEFARSFCYLVVKFLWRNVDYRNRWEYRNIWYASEPEIIIYLREGNV